MATVLPMDELNLLEKNPRYDYQYTDKVIKALTLRIIRKFQNAKMRVLRMSEREIIRFGKEFYADLYKDAFFHFGKIADYQYHDAGGTGRITDKWLRKSLRSYDPVMKRVFENEADRKASVFIESVISAADRAEQVDIRMREWSRFVNQGALDVTDQAVMKAFEEDDEDDESKYVWITKKDERVCAECESRHGHTFRRKNIPVKHPNCRCIVRPVR